MCKLSNKAKIYFAPSIAYSKRVLNDLNSDLSEYIEFLCYMEHDLKNAKSYIKKEKIKALIKNAQLKTIELKEKITEEQRELNYFIDKYKFTTEELNSIEPATDEQIKEDEEKDLMDIEKDLKKYGNRHEVLLKAYADMPVIKQDLINS